MLTELYVDALFVDEELADQVWKIWSKGETDDETAYIALDANCWFSLLISEYCLSASMSQCNIPIGSTFQMVSQDSTIYRFVIGNPGGRNSSSL